MLFRRAYSVAFLVALTATASLAVRWNVPYGGVADPEVKITLKRSKNSKTGIVPITSFKDTCMMTQDFTGADGLSEYTDEGSTFLVSIAIASLPLADPIRFTLKLSDTCYGTA